MKETPKNKAKYHVSSRSAVEDAIDAAKDFPQMTWKERVRTVLGHIPRWDKPRRDLPAPVEPASQD